MMLVHKTIRLILTAMIVGCFAVPSVFAQDDDDKVTKIRGLMREGGGALQTEDWDIAAEAYAKVVKLDPKNALAWQLHGYALHADGKLDAAIKSHMKAAETAGEEQGQIKGVALYNLGCAYSLKKEKKKAMDYLDKAIDTGFVDENYFETDPDLDNLRKDERFKKILAVVKDGGRKQEEKSEGKDKKFDLNRIVGKWKVTAGSRAGEEVGSERLPPEIKITTKTITIPTPDGEAFVMAYKIDASKKPIAIDIEIESGPQPEGKAVGIIKFEKGSMTLCYDPTGQKRPDKFKTSEDNGRFMFVMKKNKEKADKKDDK